MKSFTSFTLPLATLAALANAQGGVVENAAVASAITNAALTFDGSYTLENVATGKFLSFVRDTASDRTNFYTQDEKTAVTLETDSGEGDTGTVINGLTKCASAQWGFQTLKEIADGSWDYAAVSYACKVGADAVSNESDLVLAKQLWKLIPCGSASSTSDTATSNAVNLNAVVSSSSGPSVSDADFTSAYASSTYSADESSSSADESSSAVDPKNRYTWICRHPGWWLAAHWQYVYSDEEGGGHVECAARLQAYWAANGKRFVKHKRGGHVEIAHAVEKREIERRADSTYCIITTDHLTDMHTRAIGSSQMDTFGGYISQELVVLDKTDANQQWIVTAA